MKVPPILKAIIALCFFFLSINGVAGNMISPLLRMDHVIEEDQEFLKKCMS